MDAPQAARNLELIRTLMERTTQYQFLTARAGLAAGTLAGLGALAPSAYAPRPIRFLGIAVLLLGGFTLRLGPEWAVAMMGFVFGLGHIGLGTALLIAERRQGAIRLHRSVA